MLARNLRLLIVLGTLLCGGAMIRAGDFRTTGDHTGFAPAQPIAFSHRLHAGEMGIDCRYCHVGAEQSRHAGIPEASICMNCHATVAARRDAVVAERMAAEKAGREPRPVVSAEIAKLWRAQGLNERLERDPAITPKPIEWVRVHQLPDFVYFDHRPHVLGGVACESCHGPVQSMDRVRQFASLSMGWCIDCHRTRQVALPTAAPPGHGVPGHAPAAVLTDCATCHF
ncbi:MAG: hypothetical protein FJ293_13960 [Planctomycetes bacterium]|nr:hypothetical protein [Planctomycetota bacterium]